MNPLPAPIITRKSSRLSSQMARDAAAAVILILEPIGVYMVTVITEIMMETPRLAGEGFTSVLLTHTVRILCTVLPVKDLNYSGFVS